MSDKPFRDDRPLDALIPGLNAPPPDHAFLEIPLEKGFEWAVAIKKDPGGAAALHHYVGHLMEAALLSALSRPASDKDALSRRPARIHLLLYVNIPGDLTRALKAFGFSAADLPENERWLEPLGGAEKPLAAFLATVSSEGAPLSNLLEHIQERLIKKTAEPWGEDPGAPSARLLEILRELTPHEFKTDLASVDGLEASIVSRTPNVIRWLPPLILQAACDLIGVVAQRELAADLEWSVAEPEPDGFVPPPVFRVNGSEHVPIALHLLRWWMMPLQPSEQVPPISAWMLDQFTTPES